MSEIRLPEINHIIISGRLTRDADNRMTQKGQAVCGFDVAVNRRYLDNASGEWKDEVAFVPVSVFGPAAERAKDKLKKGAPVVVEGRINMNEFTDKSGQNRKVLRVLGNRIQILQTLIAADNTTAEDTQETPQEEISDDVPF